MADFGFLFLSELGRKEKKSKTFIGMIPRNFEILIETLKEEIEFAALDF